MIKIPFCRPYIDDKEAEESAHSVRSGWITTGKATEEVENKIAKYVGAKHCILLTSCTAAIHLSLEYLKTKLKNPKDAFSVLVPSLTFAATATEVVHAGGDIIFGDVWKESMCLCPASYEKFDIAIPVHLYGVKADTTCYKCPVIEDSAHLIEKNQLVDNPNLVCYSFYATKNVTMGEGGAICTNDYEAYEWIKKARHHGISKGGWDRYKTLNTWQYDIEFIGWKYNPSDVLASILLENFNKIDEIHKERRRCVKLYNSLLGYHRTGLHLYPILVNDRPKFMEFMSGEGIQCSVHFFPLHQMTAFKNLGAHVYDMKNTEYFGDRVVSLPLFPGLQDYEIEFICKKVHETGLLIKQ